VEWVGGNADAKIIAEEPYPDYLNYYNRVTQEEGATHVRQFRRIIYKNIYPNIDVVFYAGKGVQNNKGFEFDFVIHPGGKPENIVLRYSGQNSLEVSGGKIKMELATGTLEEHIPVSYLETSNEKVNVTYRSLGSNLIGFHADHYSSSETLIIDPSPALVWGTFYGGTLNDYGNDVKTDGSGNVLVTGITKSSNAIATSGTYQSTFGGNASNDGFVVKMNNDGVRIWATYYGGTGYDFGRAVCVDGSDNIYATGESESPATP